MGAIFGFLGEPEHELLRFQAEVLGHRGIAPVYHRAHWGSLGYLRKRRGDPVNHRGAGLTVDGDLALAVAGFIFPESVKSPVPIHAPPPEARHDASEKLRLALIQAYRREGVKAFERLRGAFVLALLAPDRLILVRDGAGARTLYYAHHEGRFFFAVEAKALWGLPGFSRRLRPAALAQYLSFSFIPGSGTMLENIRELKPGHLVTLGPGTDREQRRYYYFDKCDGPLAEGIAETAGDPEAEARFWIDTFRRRLGTAVENRMPSGEPLGAFLSGGIDSSVVACELARLAPGRVRTFAAHFGKHYPNELEFAAAVAQRLGTDHTEVEIKPRGFLPKLRRIIWHLDDPIGDPVTMPNFELAGVVSGEMAAVFNGEGGDPCFGGPKNVPMMLHHWYGPGTDPKPSLAQAYLASYRRAYDALPHLLTPETMGRIDPARDLEGVLDPFLNGPGPGSLLHRLLAINIRLKGGHLILPKVERMLGAWDVTPLSPLFDESLMELSFAMPPRFILARGVEKQILKLAYADALPREVLDRPKCGMRVPVHYWFRKDLRRYAKKILSRRNLQRAGIFDADQVRKLLDYDWEVAGGRYGIRLWMLLTFEIWRRIVIESEPV